MRKRPVIAAALTALAITAAGCSDSNDSKSGAAPPVDAPAVAALQVSVGPHLTGTALTLTAQAADPEGDAVSCVWTLVSTPSGSAATLPAAAFACTEPVTQAFTADVPGAYVIRLTPTSGATSLVGAFAQVTVDAVDAITPPAGGDVTIGTTTPDSELSGIAAFLAQVSVATRNSTDTNHDLWMPAANLFNAAAGLTAKPAGPFGIVDVRDSEDFAKGHIPGAVNVPLAGLPDVLLENPWFPDADQASAKKVALIGYDGTGGVMGATLVSIARFGAKGSLADTDKAFGIQFGMSAWTLDRAATPARFDDDLGVRRVNLTKGAPGNWLETGSAGYAPTATFPYPAITPFRDNPSAAQKALIRARKYFNWLEADAVANGVPHREAFYATWTRYAALRGSAAAPQVATVQNPAQWAGGHVPGAIALTVLYGSAAPKTFSYSDLNKAKFIDPTKEVWVHCFSGTGAPVPTLTLGILGYKAKHFLYGNAGVTNDPATGASVLAGFDVASSHDFPMAKDGSVPANWAKPARDGCIACHTNYAAHYAEVVSKPPAGAAAEVQSEGEG